jgi:two-component system sensor kinase FixL
MSRRSSIKLQFKLGQGLIPFVFLLAYVMSDRLAVGHGGDGLIIFPWNASFAISFGALVRLGARWLPLAVIGPFLACVVGGADTSEILVRVVSEAAICAVAAAFLRAQIGARLEMDRLRNISVFFLTAFATALVLAVANVLRIVLVFDAELKALTYSFGKLALASLVAILAVSPLIIIFVPPKFRVRGRVPLIIETLLQTAALCVIAWEIFGRFANQEIHFFYLLFLPVAWIAIRHGQRGAVLALALIYLAPVATDWIFGHHDQVIVELQIRLGVLSITGLLLGAMVGEQRLAEARIEARQTEIAHFQRLNVGREMASALAHELTQPLTAAMNYTQAALRLIKAPEPEFDRASRVMEKSVDQIERVGQIIHGLRDFMRRGELRLASNDVAEMIDDAIRLVHPEVGAAGISLHVVDAHSLPPVLADKTQVVQVLVNLLRNAVQSTAGVASPSVTVQAKLDDAMVKVSVVDNGAGLSPVVAPRIFEPFITTKEAGMGLGLSVSKSIIEAHDGRLWAETPSSGGAAFYFTLPLKSKEASDA